MKRKILLFISLFLLFGVSPVFAVAGPSQQSPSDGSTVSSTTLTWQTPAYSLYSGSPYRVQVDDETTFSAPPKDYYTANTSYTPTLADGTWYWRVKAKDASGTWSDWSSTWSFILSTSSPSPSPSPTTTSTFTISNVPSSIDSTQTFKVDVSLELSSYPNTKFYVKGAFLKSGSSNYFGLTKVNNSWVKNSSSSSSQYEITTDSAGKWSGSLEVQPDVMDSGYEGTNDYIFKVARYTSSGSGPTWSNEANIKINAKEVQDAEGAVNMSGLSTPKSSAVLAESKTHENLPEIVYSLEKYKKSTPAARKISTPSAKVKIDQQKIPLYFYIIGGVLIFAAGATTVYIHEKIRN